MVFTLLYFRPAQCLYLFNMQYISQLRICKVAPFSYLISIMFNVLCQALSADVVCLQQKMHTLQSPTIIKDDK